RQTAALVLKGIGNGIELCLDLRNFGVDLSDVRLDLVRRSFRVGVKSLIFRAVSYFSFAFGGLRLDAIEITGVACDEFSLDFFPGPLAIRLVIESPYERKH